MRSNFGVTDSDIEEVFQIEHDRRNVRQQLLEKLRANEQRITALERRLALARKWIPEDQFDAYDKADDALCAGREEPYRARATAEFVTDHEKLLVPAGTEVTVLEPLPSLENPEAFIVEVAIPDDSLEGGVRFDTAELKAEELERNS